MDFQFAPEQTMTAEISVDDIGNCAIMAINDLCEQYYLITKTSLGTTKVCTFGPVVEDADSKIFNLSYYTTEYNAKKLQKTIYMFLNNIKAKITEATTISVGDAVGGMIDIGELFKGDEQNE